MVFRKVPLLLPAIAWASGIALVRTDIVAAMVAVIVLVISIIAATVLRKYRHVAVLLVVGMTWGAFSLIGSASHVSVPIHWLESTVGTTASIEKVDRYPAYSRLQLSQVEDEAGEKLAGRVLLYIYRAPRWLKTGQIISFQARWHKPRNHQNPGGFDYESYCFDRGIALIGNIRGKATLVEERASWLQSARAAISHSLDKLPQDERGVLKALLLANRTDIPVNIGDYFAASGTSHLLAISGLHVGMVSALFFFLCRFVLSRREAWIVQLRIQHIALIVGAIGAMLYATIAGWPLPAQRAAMMLVAAAIAWLFRSRSVAMNTMFLALIVILLLDPAAVASISLWLSFLATTSLVLWAKAQKESNVWGWLKVSLWVTTLASLATLPMILTVFGRIPVYTLPANVMLLPLYSLFILPSALLAEFFAVIGWVEAAETVFSWSGYAVALCNKLLAMFYQWPAGNLWVAPPAIWMTCLYITGMVIAALLLRYERPRAAITMLLSTLFLYLLLVLTERPMATHQLIVWDVGQGAASTLIFSDNKVMVIDLPGRPKSRYNGGTTVASGLRHLGITHVNYLILSHAQHDHMGGALRLMEQINHVGELWLADIPDMRSHPEIIKIVAQVEASGGKVRRLKQGDQFNIKSEHIEILWPPQGFNPSNRNNGSLVLSITSANQQRLLFPGDAEAQAERAIIAHTLDHHHITLMPHHGSLSSSHPAWVTDVSAKIVIAQTGYKNHYGFPKEEVIHRYQKTGSDIWDTADGAVMISLNSANLQVEQYQLVHSARRDLAKLWWQWLDDL
ncbi:MAG: DNA internalization-related competence protein ComEC/Rec2 [Mariprofundaceae bacterium]